jgi:hypothetical protein
VRITRRALIEAWADWLRTFTWDCFATLTFPGYPSATKACREFDGWIAEIKKLGGTRKFRYVRVLERGSGGDNIHFHVLIGGLKPDARRFPFKWAARWREVAGHAVIQRFDPKKGGVHYLLKTLLPDGDFAIELHFTSDAVPDADDDEDDE